MKALETGKYFSTSQRSVNHNGLIICDTEYINPREFPAHYHENLYIAYVVKGSYTEESGKKKTCCLPGAVIFHNECEQHSNSGFSSYSRIINLEIRKSWLAEYDIDAGKLAGNIKSNSIDLQCCMMRILEEYIYNDPSSKLEIEASVMKILGGILTAGSMYTSGMPAWVKFTKELINDGELASLSLKYISETAGIHPMHLSRDFQRYFNASFSEYVRKVRVEKARAMLMDDEIPLASIANDCGFSDQSHFTRVFKRFTGVTPLQYRDLSHTRPA